jgi:hypothetical protein
LKCERKQQYRAFGESCHAVVGGDSIRSTCHESFRGIGGGAASEGYSPLRP